MSNLIGGQRKVEFTP